jgi:UDP-N-acetyl-D-mannosaminuronate dehydrogenase
VTSHKPRVAVLGYSYLEGSDDIRNSPSKTLVDQMVGIYDVKVHDPFVQEYSSDVFEVLSGCDAALIMVAHAQYRTLDLRVASSVMANPIFIDGRRVINERLAREAGITAVVLGKA